MKVILILLSLFLTQTACSYDLDPSTPRIDFEYEVILSTSMETALKKYDKEFKIFKAQAFEPFLRKIYSYKILWFDRKNNVTGYQTPSALIGDFNGDGIADAILIGHNKTQGKLIAILSKDKEYIAMEVRSWSCGEICEEKEGNLEGCLELIPVGTKIKAEPAYNRPEINLKTDAFEFGGETGSSLFYYKDEKFIEYALSD